MIAARAFQVFSDGGVALHFRPSPADTPHYYSPNAAHVMPERTASPGRTSAIPDLESTVDLLARVRSGDDQALDRLFERYLQPLTRWARGRLPSWARDLRETDDLVQDALTQTLKHVREFEPQGSGALFGYLRQAVLNRLRDEIRRVGARRLDSISDHFDDLVAGDPSPLEEVLGKDMLEAYDRSLERLSPEDREAVVARVEMGASYAEIAEITDRPSADAARMAVSRALLKLAKEIADARR
jgi:RNA polymerase sigma-70 factor (ECF subfamily)